jgi:thioredoxin 1
MMHPVIGKLSKIYEGKLKCFKLNTDDNQEVATRYGIRSIPTIIIFKNGEKKDAIIGAVPESDLVTTIVKYIAN